MLLDLLKGSGVAAARGSEFALSDLLSDIGGNVWFVWPSKTSVSAKLPVSIVGEGEVLHDLIAWSAAYMKPISPLSSLINILEARELYEMAGDRASNLTLDERVALVLGESWLTLQLSGKADVTLGIALSTLSFALGRCKGLSLSMLGRISDEWSEARELAELSGATLPIAREVYRELVGGRESNSDDLFAADRGASNEMLSEILKLSPEDRVSIFDELALNLVRQQDRTLAAKYLGRLAAACRPGDFELISLLRPYVQSHPTSVLWFALAQASDKRSNLMSMFDGIGWRIWRDLQTTQGLLRRPTCDIALKELRVLSRAKGYGRGASRFGRSTMQVQLSFGTSSLVRFVEPQGHRVQVKSSAVVTRSVGELDIAGELGALRRQIGELKEVLVARNSTERKIRKKTSS